MSESMEKRYRVHRMDASVGEPFNAPSRVTFGWQGARKGFSVWYSSEEVADATYVVLGTGHEYPEPFDVVATAVLPDGFHAFHLCRLGTEYGSRWS